METGINSDYAAINFITIQCLPQQVKNSTVLVINYFFLGIIFCLFDVISGKGQGRLKTFTSPNNLQFTEFKML